jgi:signal transduction histidine kinase
LFVGATAFWLSQSLERQLIEQYKSVTTAFAQQVFVTVILDSDGPIGTNDSGLLEQSIFLDSFVEGDVIYGQIVHDGKLLEERQERSKFDDEIPVSEVSVGTSVSHHQSESGIAYVDITRSLEGREDLNPDANVDSYVRLGLSLESFQKAFQNQLFTLVLIGIAIVVVGAILGWMLFLGLWSPIRQLIDAVQRFGKGDLTAKAPLDREDELGTLAKEFNMMGERISEKNHELEKLNEELESSNRAKTEFLTIMSHELRTPLNAILGYTELLADGKYGELEEDQRLPLRRMLRAGGHLLSLIENTLNYAKLELGVEKLHLVEIDSLKLINDCLEQLQPLAEERGIPIRVTGDKVSLTADLMKLRQILLNLLQNAIQNTETGDVTISCKESKGEVLFSVRDSGYGIRDGEIDGLFNPFFRGERASERSQSGVGLGLTVVDRYTRMHGGRINIESELDEGTTFIISLPKHSPITRGRDD